MMRLLFSKQISHQTKKKKKQERKVNEIGAKKKETNNFKNVNASAGSFQI